MVEIIATCGVTTALLTTVVVVVSIPASREKNKDGWMNKDVGKRLLKFLNEANDQYLLACETNKIDHFSRYCTRGFCDRLFSLLYADAEIPLYSQKAYSMVEWRIKGVNEEDACLEIEKIVRFRDIRVNGARVKLSEDSLELWYVNKVKDSFLISNIV